MESLNEIFEEILHSEKDFTDKVTKLRHIDALIKENEKKLHNAKSTTESLYGEYLLKTQKTVDCSAQAQLRRSEYEALVEQERELRNEEEGLTTRVAELKQKMEYEREQFITEVTEFSLNYDLCGNGVLRRESKEKEKIDNLRKDLIKLEDEMDAVVSQEKRIDDKSTELDNIESEIANERENHTDLQKKLENLKTTVSELTEEKTALDASTNGGEFQRMQRELDACRNCQEERDCINLMKMLQNLQKENYKKQMKHLTKRQVSSSAPHTGSAHVKRRHQLEQQQSQTGTVSYQHTSAPNELLGDLDISDHEHLHEDDIDEYDLASIEAIENIEYIGGNLEDSSDDQQHTEGPTSNTAGTVRVNKLPPSLRGNGSHAAVNSSWYKIHPMSNVPSHTAIPQPQTMSMSSSSDTVVFGQPSKRHLPRKSVPNLSMQSSTTTTSAMTRGKGSKTASSSSSSSSSSRLCPSSKRVRFAS